MLFTAAFTRLPEQHLSGSQSPLLRHVANDDALAFTPPAPEADYEPAIAPDIDLRQLRHHTKNTLQRILGLISESAALRSTPEGERIARELEYRISLSATISNTLFGLTNAPASMAERLRLLAGAMIDMMSRSDQKIRVGVSVRGYCPTHLREAVMRAAHELIGNAVKHGMRNRPSGRISVRLVSEQSKTTLKIVDNGWGFVGNPVQGEGLALARSFSTMHGGSLRLDGSDGTVARMELPHDADRPAQTHLS